MISYMGSHPVSTVIGFIVLFYAIFVLIMYRYSKTKSARQDYTPNYKWLAPTDEEIEQSIMRVRDKTFRSQVVDEMGPGVTAVPVADLRSPTFFVSGSQPASIKRANEQIEEFHDQQPVLDLLDEMPRIPMQSRFTPDNPDTDRAAALAEQIVLDQKVAGIDAGPVVDAPAPGEPGYEPPHEVITVPVGPYTVYMMRDALTVVSEARLDGSEGDKADVPVEWEPVIVALAMEIVRLREGWSVSAAL